MIKGGNMKIETIEEFIERGGKIQKLKSSVKNVSSNTSRRNGCNYKTRMIKNCYRNGK
jgi:hypothetical protein